MILLTYHRGDVGGDGADQGKPGEDGDELLGQGGEDHHDRAGEGPADQIEHAIGDARDIALGGVLMRILAGAQGRRNSRDDDGDAAEERHPQ
jgi:hypothetical protein